MIILGLLDSILKRTPNIEKLENKKDVDSLITLLNSDWSKPNNIDIIVNAAKALSRIGDKKAIKPIESKINELSAGHILLCRINPSSSPDPFAHTVLVAYLGAAIPDLKSALSTLQKSTDALGSDDFEKPQIPVTKTLPQMKARTSIREPPNPEDKYAGF